MDEIKFKLWDSSTKTWLSPYEYCFNCRGILEDPQSTIKIVQYIGIKDRNKKEVYDGDIIKFKTEVSTIRWDKKILGWAPFCHLNLDKYDFEIIGHIYMT